MAAADPQHKTLQDMVLLGVSMDGQDYVVQHGTLTPARGPSALKSNGNPYDMLTVVRELMEGENRRALFIVERDTNRNVLMYLADSSQLAQPLWLMVKSPPVHYNSNVPLRDDEEVDLGNVFVEELTALENAVGYGLVEGANCIYLQALKQQPIFIEKLGDEWHARIQISDSSERLYLRRIFICTEPRPIAPWPKITEVHVQVQQRLDGPLITYRYEA